MQQIIRILQSSSIYGLFLDIVPITFFVGLIYAVYRFVHIKRQEASISWSTRIIPFAFCLLSYRIDNLVLVPTNFWTYFWLYVRNSYSDGKLDILYGTFNLVPTLYKCLIGEIKLGSWVKEMLLGNILMFVSMGVFLPLAITKITKRNIFLPIAITIPIVIAFIQPIIGRSFDIDNVICNFIGIVIGYFLVFVAKLFMEYRHHTHKQSL